MKKIMSLLFTLCLLLFITTSAEALSLGFTPSSQTVILGETVDVALSIVGLGNFAPDSLGAFDLDISFDPGILSFNSAAFGDPILGDQLDLFGLGSLTDIFPHASGSGVVNLFELSFDLAVDLDTLQAGAFTLATLTFDTIALGTSALDLSAPELSGIALSDSLGNPLLADVIVGSVIVNPVPEPATLLLLVTGTGILAGFRKKFIRN